VISAELLPQGTAAFINNRQKRQIRHGGRRRLLKCGSERVTSNIATATVITFRGITKDLIFSKYRTEGQTRGRIHAHKQHTINPPELPPPAAAASCQQQSGKDNSPDFSLLQTLTVPQLVKKKSRI